MRYALLVHVICGALGLLSGAIALYAAKGARVHRRSGMFFVYAMVTMGLTGAGIAALTGVETSVMMGLLTTYLVITSLTTVRPPSAGLRWLDLSTMLVATALGFIAFMFGIESSIRGEAVRSGMPVPMFFVFGTIALLAAASDVRVIRSGRPTGARRLARHLWRMCFGLFIASASFFLGQSDKFPESLRIMPVLLGLALAPVVILLYWMWRVRIRKSLRGIVGVTSPEAG